MEIAPYVVTLGWRQLDSGNRSRQGLITLTAGKTQRVVEEVSTSRFKMHDSILVVFVIAAIDFVTLSLENSESLEKNITS